MNKKLIFIPLLTLSMYAYAQNTSNPNIVSKKIDANVIQVVGANEINNRVNLNASGKQEVDQDNLMMTLTYTTQSKDPKIVQDALRKEIANALAQAKSRQNGKQLSVKSGQFSVYPKYEKQQLVNWVGQGSIILEGQDFGLVGNTAAELKNLVVSNISLGLSSEKVESLKEQTIKQAVTNFKNEAQKITQLFGFTSYRMKEVSVNYNNPIMPRGMMMMAKTADSSGEGFAVEPGKTTLEATVSGSIEMY